jgi:type VI secretion system protein
MPELSGHRGNALQQLQIAAAIDANQSSATAIDVVWVFNPAVLASLPATAPEWFAKRSALQSALASDIMVQSLELPPASLSYPPLPPQHAKAVAVLVFANYIAPSGQARGRLGEQRCERITLRASNVDYGPC